MTASDVQLSVILPCHGAAATVARSVETLVTYLPRITTHWEVIVVDDGANDFGAHPLTDDPRVRLIRHRVNLGKGAAVRSGVLAATGHVRLFTDADLPYDRELIEAMSQYVTTRGFHLVIGDRTLAGSRYAPATGVRRLLSAVASWSIGSLVTGGFHDTQCGIKAIRGDVAQALFPLVRTPGFAFDVEVLYIALKHGLDVKRVPVRLRRNEASSVRPLRDGVLAALAIAAIKWRQVRGCYASPVLDAIVAAESAAVLTRCGISDPSP